MAAIFDSNDTEIAFDVGSLAASDHVNNRGVANFAINKSDTSTPIDVGADVYIVDDTNMFLYPLDLTNAAISAIGLTAVGGYADPFGGSNAFRLTDDGTSTHYMFDELAAQAREVYTMSLYVKKWTSGNADWITFRFREQTNANYVDFGFNLTTGALGTAAVIGDFELVDVSMIAVSADWYRCILTIRTGALTAGNLQPLVLMSEANRDYTYTGVGDTMDVYGLQVELGFGASDFVDHNQRLWGGVVLSISETDIQKTSSTHRRLTYACADFDALASRKRVAASYENMTAGAIVESIRAAYLADDNVTAGTIESGNTITIINFSYVQVDKALDELAALNGFDWKIDENKTLQFKSRLANAAPWSIDTDKDFTYMSRIRSLSEYRNKQYVRGATQVDAGLSEILAGDGNRLAHVVSKAVNVVTNIETNIAGAGYTTKTFDVLGETGSDFYYQVGSHTISQDAAGTPLNAADLIRITYDGQTVIIVESQLDLEIASRAAVESGAGEYHDVMTDHSIEHVDVAIDAANSLLERFGIVNEKIVFHTNRSGLSAGQLMTIEHSELNISGSYLIESVSYSIRDDNRFRHSVVAVSGEAFGGWVRFFEMLQNRGGSVIIRGNEILYLMRSQTDAIVSLDTALAQTSTTFGFTIGNTRSNIALRSDDFDNATWAKNASTISSNVIVDPYGTQLADELIENSDSSQSHHLQQATSITNGATYCLSVFGKANTRNWLLVDLDETGFASNAAVWFDLTNGVVGTVGGSAVDYGIQSWGNGWYRCWVTAVANSAGANNILIRLGDADNSAIYNGDGVSSLYLFGSQFEAGKNASAYIPTTTTAVAATRDCKIGIETLG